ncbi:protein-tyrosine-phosphatase [Plasmodiophora brassicae]|uniref:protein-tyrosine-phosphatase n=2 Tax=Plasmodiophora brassicae TaxID=37360 RepID=A0A3P3Y9H6_PLABS|nr:unnamed protein product [Plasmodiophora brassicae]
MASPAPWTPGPRPTTSFLASVKNRISPDTPDGSVESPVETTRHVRCVAGAAVDGPAELAEPALPTVDAAGRSIPLVSCDIVAALISEGRDDVLIVDCRYDYEHAGGHLPGAVSVNTFEALVQLHEDLRHSPRRPVIVVFHCEFSQQRAPKSFAAFRALDRAANIYPLLTFPQMFVMEGGYRQFFHTHPTVCSPSNYVPMHDPVLSKLWRKQTVACKRSWAKRKAPSLERSSSGERTNVKRFEF